MLLRKFFLLLMVCLSLSAATLEEAKKAMASEDYVGALKIYME